MTHLYRNWIVGGWGSVDITTGDRNHWSKHTFWYIVLHIVNIKLRPCIPTGKSGESYGVQPSHMG